MKDPRLEYEVALADFSQPGNRWTAKGRLTYWGKAAGLTAAEIISDVRAHGVTDRDADIRRGWNDAKQRGDRRRGDWQHYTPRAKPKPSPTFPRYVRDMVAAGGGEVTSADLRALSPYWWTNHAPPVLSQTAPFLRLFDPVDVLHIFRDDAPTAGKPGQSLMPCRDWLEIIEGGGTILGDLIVSNPFTGAEGETTDGRKSYIAQSCLARFPFLVVEFDSMPLKAQAAFWRGLLSYSPLAPKVASITYSGGKSLHGLLHVGCRTLADWQAVRGQLRGLLAADPDPAFRADEQAMRPRTGTRLPGVRRFSNGKLQSLLYLNPEAVRPTAKKPDASTATAEPRETHCKHTDAQTADIAPEADGRAVEPLHAVYAHCAPLPPMPPDDAPLDDVLAYFDVLESMEGVGVGTPEGVRTDFRPMGEVLQFKRFPLSP